MKKYLVAMLIAVLAVLTLTACSKQTEQISEDIGDPVPMEYILSNTDLTAEDFEDVDYEAFMSEMGLSMANIEDKIRMVPLLLELYIIYEEEERLYGPKIDYTTIYDNARGRLKEEDLDNIEVVICDYHEGFHEDRNECIVLDYSTNKVYSYNRSSFLCCCNDAYLTSKLSQSDRDWLIGVLEESEITSWKKEYIRDTDVLDGGFSLEFAFRLNDGRCVRYVAVDDVNGMPDGMFYLFSKLSERFFADD
ncbi:MAG: hypothetical protein E7559_04695 [Ruminococcaceae bacterium]|nr:hypothetical protein [Oscillospiraceae bacterium]